MKYKLLWLIFFLSVAMYSAAAPEYSEEISVVLSKTENQSCAEFRSETIVRSTLAGVVALFENIESMPLWVYRMKEAKLLKRLSPTVVIVRTINALPLPLHDRDAVLYTVLSQDKNGVMRITGTSMSSYYPLQDNLVRIENIWSVWELTPLPGGYLKAVFAGSGDPGGVIPLWLYNRLLGEAPRTTMQNFRKIIREDRYQSAKSAIIKEYPDGYKQ